MIGQVLGKYRIEAELSRGGMGAVYRARHELIERTAAVKLLRPEMTSNPELVSRFVNEARAASAIQHPGIIEIFDFGTTEDGQAYLVMELLQGETLTARLRSRGTLHEGEAVKITRGIAGALAAAHAKGIIHRDLKPDNVFLVPDPDIGERPKVLDFGIAKLLEGEDSNTRTGALMGTPLYMAPEQARSAGAIDHRADLYSLGCILYELLTGKPPLEGDGAGEIIALHMFQEPARPRTLVPSLTPALEEIVMRLLEKEPSARFMSAADVSNALSEAFGTSVVRPATPLPRAPRPSIDFALPPGVRRGPAKPDLAIGPGPAAVAAPTIAPAGARPRNFLPIAAAGITLVIAGAIAIAVALGRSHDDAGTARTTPPPPRVQVEPPAPVAEPVPAPTPPPPAETPPPSAPSRPKASPKRPPGPKALPKTDKDSPVETSI